MPDATEEFFEGVTKRPVEPLLGNMKATIRFDIADGDRMDQWLLRIDHGALDLARSSGEADCIVIAEKAAFDQVAAGKTNAMAAFLRGAIVLDGDPRFLVGVQRLFPAPVGMPEIAGDRSVGKRRS